MSTSFIEHIREACNRADSFTRLDTLLSMHPGRRSKKRLREWFIAFGEQWTGCDTIGHNQLAIRLLFVWNKDMWRLMMDENENKVFDSLPENMTLYRGCGPVNRMGLSWSLNPEVARRFPALHRYHQKTPLLITASVPKKRIVAVKLDREESEVIALVDPRDIVSEETITEVLT